MMEKFKRKLLRKRLKKEKLRILGDLYDVNRKLKILNELDKKEDKTKNKK